ncbi:MAG: hypothetical protein NXH91_12165 [Phyllobacteriaceae bacterium]|nr:hypothetical protein [Phyllobacteriaceae bacterium]
MTAAGSSKASRTDSVTAQKSDTCRHPSPEKAVSAEAKTAIRVVGNPSPKTQRALIAMAQAARRQLMGRDL